MIKQSDTVGWALLMFELQDAKDHLIELMDSMNKTPDYDEEEFRVDLGHIYSYLNRAWLRRNIPEDFPEGQWEAAPKFPIDL